MVTVRTGKAAAVLGLLLLAACSREQQDWRSAEAADSIEAYDRFVQHHPESELAVQARARLVQLQEDRDWQTAGTVDSAEAYRHFITEHPTGRWAQEARIRMENFALGAQTGLPDAAHFVTPRVPLPAVVAANPTTEAPKAFGSSDNSIAQNSRRVWTSRLPEVPATSAGQQLPDTPEVQTVPAPQARADKAAQISDAATAELGTSLASGTNAIVSADAPTEQPSEPTAMAFAVRTSSGTSSVDGFGIQLGSFRTAAAASSAWSFASTRFAPELQGLSPRVVAAETSAGRVFRLQMNVGDEGRARSLCSVLRARGQSCLPVPPH